MIGVFMGVRTKPGTSEEFQRLATQLQSDVRANEPGALLYQVMRDAEDPNYFIYVEIFADEQAYTAHPDMPYHVSMSEAAWACVEGQPDIRRFVPLGDAP